MPRIVLVAAMSVAAAVAVPSLAQGATLYQEGRTPQLLSGGPGNDRINARDGAPDTVDCGGQALDWAAVDIDVEASIAGCAQIAS